VLQAIDDVRRSAELGATEWEGGEPDHSGSPLVVHRGNVVDAILEEVTRSRPTYWWSGTAAAGRPARSEAGSVARRLMHVAPCAVLTVPL